MIKADTLLSRALGRPDHWVDDVAADLNFDARQEVQLANDQLVATIAPAAGGMLYELDVRSIALNLAASITRRPEAYHQKILAGAGNDHQQAASIHDRIVMKQDDLDQRLQYDAYPRKSLIDHFFDTGVSLDTVAAGLAAERGDFLTSPYEAKLRRSSDRIQVQLTREGAVDGLPVKVTKGVTIERGSSTLDIAYLVEGLPADRPLEFAVEMNFAGLPSGADDRFFFDASQNRLGHLGTRLDLHDVDCLGLIDQWQGIELRLESNQPTNFWTFPIETVSQSEGGFELVHQSVAVLPHWTLLADQHGKWSVELKLAIDAPWRGDLAKDPEQVATAL